MWSRPVRSMVLAALLVSCGDGPTEPVPERSSTVAAPSVAFATTTTEDGLSISTDKDDYQPGDTVHFTGTGWQPGDVLDIVLVDEPATHDPHLWSVNVGEDGTFHDSTYVVDTGDLGVTFTLTATSRLTGRSLTVIFTDGQLRLIAPVVLSGLQSFPFSPGTLTLTAQNPTQGSGANPHTNVKIRIRTPQTNLNQSPALVKELNVAASLSEPNSASIGWDGTNTANSPIAEGLYMARVFSTETPEDDNGNRKVPIVVDKTAPTIAAVALSLTTITQGQSVAITLSGTATDPIATGATAGHYRIASAQFNRDAGSFAAMAAQDGTFNDRIENLTITIAAGTIAGLPPGSHPFCVKATDAAGNESSSTANCVTLLVNAATTTTVSSSKTPSGSGESVTFTAAVKFGSPATPVTTGKVTFKEGGSSCADAAATQLQAATDVSGSGEVTFTTSTLSIGSHIIRGCYGGATGFLLSEGSATQQVNNTATVTEIASSVNSSVTGQSVTFTATVKSGGSAIGAHGAVSFRQGSTTCANGIEVKAATNLDASGQATYTTSFLASGSPFNIRACYGGATGFDPSNGFIDQTVNKAATTTTIDQVSPSPVTFGQQVTVNFSVAPEFTGTPTGMVAVKDGSNNTLCSAMVAVGLCSFYPAGAGALSLTAHYAGDDEFKESTSAAAALTVDKAPTTTSVDLVSPSPVTFGQQVTVTFSVAPANSGQYGSVVPTGTVRVEDGSSNLLCSGTVAAGNCSFYPAGAGPLSFAAHYQGDVNFLTSTSAAENLTVNRAPTTTTIDQVSPDPATFGQQATVDFSVIPANSGNYGLVVPTGTVQIKDGSSNLLCSATVAAGSCNFYPAGAGTLSLTAYYIGVDPGNDGDANFLASSSVARSLTVNRAATTTAITSISPLPPYIVNGQVTVNFGVTPDPGQYGSVVPTGTVEVKNGSTVLCSGVLPASSCNFTPTSVGVYSLTANYTGTGPSFDGDANFLASSSSTTEITVKYTFLGFFAPVDRPNTYNLSKAGQAIPLKFRLVDANNMPVSNLTAVNIKVGSLSCGSSPVEDLIEEYAPGASGLQNQGNGYYQFNWKTPGNYATLCKSIGLDFGGGYVEYPVANFHFKK